ncbi:MAG: peptidyl-prolyl cis-trans isomerase [Fibromonadaceae bacterium]|jgi:peptidyl-prolyl cis-trans isomerase C|nr:peptidyl-prolyl cis-trans isomerase [Fibromonadaceae bacterium]
MLIIILTSLFLISCDIEFWKDKAPVIAEVEDSRLSINVLKESYSQDSFISKEEWTKRIEFWINSEVMYREALKRGLQKDPVVKKLLKDAEKKILVDRLRLSIEDSAEIVTDKEIQDYYENNKDLFSIDSMEYIPFSTVQNQIRNIILAKKRLAKEKRWLSEIKNNYSIEVYPQYLDSL